MVVLEEIIKLVEGESFKEALTKIDQLEKDQDLSNDDQIEIILLKSTVFMRVGEFELSNDLLSELLGREKINSLQVIDAMIIRNLYVLNYF